MHISFCIHSCVTFLWKVFDLPIFAHLWISISCEVVTCCAYKCRWDRNKQWEILQSFAASCELIRIHRANLEPIHIHLGWFVGMTAASLRVSWCPECRLVWKKMRASAESSYQRIKMKALAWTSENWNASLVCLILVSLPSLMKITIHIPFQNYVVNFLWQDCWGVFLGEIFSKWLTAAKKVVTNVWTLLRCPMVG